MASHPVPSFAGSNEDDYVWDTSPDKQPPPEVLKLWTEVGERIDSTSTVFFESSATPLNHALRYLSTCKEARSFAERYAGTVVQCMSSQSPSKITANQCAYVQDSLLAGCLLVIADLKVQLNGRPNHKIPGESRLLESIVPYLFSKLPAFYNAPPSAPGGEVNLQNTLQQGNANETNPNGFPQVRLAHIEVFRTCDGFSLLNTYLRACLPFSSTGNPKAFPTLETFGHVLSALHDSLPSTSSASSSPTISTSELSQQKEADAISICQTLMQYFQHLSDDALKMIPSKLLRTTLQSLRKILDRWVDTRRAVCVQFYAIWRSIIHTLLFSSSHPLQLAGWEEIDAMIKSCAVHRPPPRQYVVSNAGLACVNGIYDYAGPTTTDGFFPRNVNVSYARSIPADVPKYGGRKLTLFRCRMHRGNKRWFFSIADEAQPGTDRDIDFYQHNAPDAAKLPPTDGWTTSRITRGTSPPQLQPIGAVVPPGYATFEHQMAAWVLKHNIVERVLRTTTMHPDLQAQVHPLMQFLFDVSARDADFTGFGLIPALCEGSRQRREPIVPQGVSFPTNVAEAHPAKKSSTLAHSSERGVKASRKRVAMEMPMGGSKRVKMDLPEHQRHRHGQGTVDVCSSIEKLSNRKLQLLREYRKADDDFLKIEIKAWIRSINEQLEKVQNDLKELLKECETDEARVGSAFAPDELGASNAFGSSGDTTFPNHKLNSGDDKDCSLDSDSIHNSDGSHSADEGQV